MDIIDLRSDTVSHPTPEMRTAMANAIVGDDVYGEDPTVNDLEKTAAEMLGFEAGLFVTSGTQGNLISLMVHCERGTEAIIGDSSHIFKYEAGGIASIAGVMPHTIKVQADGTLDLDDIKHAIRGDNVHFPRTRLVCVENTQNSAGGVALSPAYMHSVAHLAKEHGMKMHVDGARIFNAATAHNVSIDKMVRGADSVTFCLSKALCAPAGSILVGSKAFLDEARRKRKLLGGGMRQAGILAAAGKIALCEMSQRLHVDHQNASYLAESLSEVPHIRVLQQATNFVFFWLDESAPIQPDEFVAKMREHKVYLGGYPGDVRRYRAVVHYWINRESVETIAHAMKAVLA